MSSTTATAAAAAIAPVASASGAPPAQRARVSYAASEDAAGDAVFGFPIHLPSSAATSTAPVSSVIASPPPAPAASVSQVPAPSTAVGAPTTSSTSALPPALPAPKSRLDRVSTTSSPGLDECRAFLGTRDRDVSPLAECHERDGSQSPPLSVAPSPQPPQSSDVGAEAAAEPAEIAEAGETRNADVEAEAETETAAAATAAGEPVAEGEGEADGGEEPVEERKALDDPVRKSLLKRQCVQFHLILIFKFSFTAK